MADPSPRADRGTRHAVHSKIAASQSGNRGSMMQGFFRAFPLLLFPVLVYVLLAVQGVSPEAAAAAAERDLSPMTLSLSDAVLRIPMISGVDWSLTEGDIIVLAGIAFLFIEIVKSSSTGTATIVNHGASMVLFVVCLILFLIVPNYATSTFFILTVITLLDVLAGMVVTIVSARRDFGGAVG